MIAVILFTLFNLGAFGVTIEQHLCCHAQQEESTSDHCTDDESCCEDNSDCCDEIVQQVKIDKDFTSQGSKINFELGAFTLPAQIKFYTQLVAQNLLSQTEYASSCYFPPPTDFQVLFSSFLI